MRGIAVAAALVCGSIAGCVKLTTTFCPLTGAECPEGSDASVCLPLAPYCGTATQLEDQNACTQLMDFQTCSTPDFMQSATNAVCYQGSCTACTHDLLGCQYMGWVPMDSGTTYDLIALWAVGPGDVFAVGDHDTIVHYDGFEWSAFPAPSAAKLSGVGGVDDNSLFVTDGTALYAYSGTWSTVSSPANEITQVKTQSRTDILATGLYFSGPVTMGYLGQFNGSSWDWLQNGAALMVAVWAAGMDDIHVATSAGTILHFNGTWTTEFGAANTVSSMYGASPTAGFAVGQSDEVTGELLRFDGSNWMNASLSLPMSTAPLNGVWGSSDSDVYAVGATILHWDGSMWSTETDVPTGAPTLKDVAGNSANDVYAVGAGGEILHYTGLP